MRMPERPTTDLSFLEGCWRTDPFRHFSGQGDSGVSTYCFDRNGRGTLVYRRGNRSCRAPAQARYDPGGALRIVDADSRCDDGSPWGQDRLNCRQSSGGVAVCSGEGTNPGSGRLDQWSVNLHRVAR